MCSSLPIQKSVTLNPILNEIIQSTSWYPITNLIFCLLQAFSIHQSMAPSPVLSQIIQSTSWYPTSILICAFCSSLHVKRNMPLNAVLSQTVQSTSWYHIPILIFLHLCVGLMYGLLSSGVLTKVMCKFLIFPMYATCSVYSVIHNLIRNNSWQRT